ncbi:uncharacterized protein TOT_030000623 [Theileria orientalis strain Shintoku]|uniref:PPIase cyclophilin-type domain-containing protein n=1 Tax=Theileria orientalis strain Shintoku TaxID=869250 RepID=J4C408_THEOR|nr:uncharacterized protein TOT_030000623 [Theileria orientalis strain Shintoku]BAM41361.1 uncharacterized protein TOT_030000623 [Theileria orientalis strain Shintoku]|eukprot:XP_009691662.1 uncharacterized protein TOT_030000623 [Theileria orientalis strain Shintoku]
MGRHPQIYLDVAVGSNLSGRVVVDFFTNSSDLLIENFIKLCSSSKLGRPKLLTYRNTSVFRVIKGEYMQCGDVINDDGTGYKFDLCFKDYPNTRSHSQAGLVTMVNYRGYSPSGSDKNADSEFTTNTFGSQFCILFGSSRSFDGRYSVIGRVVSGMEFVRAIENVSVHANGMPRIEVAFIDCGVLDRVETKLVSKEVNEQRRLLEGLMASATSASEGLTKTDEQEGISAYEEVRCAYSGKVKNRRKPDPESSNTLGKRLLAESLKGVKHHYIPTPTSGTESRAFSPDKDEVPEQEDKSEHTYDLLDEADGDVVKEEEVDPITLRLMKLTGKISECSRLNKKEVILEDKLKSNPRLARSLKSTLTKESSKQGGDEEEVVNIRLTKELNMPAMVVERVNKIEKKKSKNKSFGWNVFNQDALYRAHKKRLKETGFNHVLYEKQKQQLGGTFYEPTIVNHEASETNKDLVVKNVEKQYKKRDQFSRRRTYDDDAQDISYINERNRMFNKKLDRSFGAYSEEIKRNLERGTAL